MKLKRPIALLLCVLLMSLSFAACGDSGSGGSGEVKSYTLTVTHGDGSTKSFELQSSQEKLGAALLDEELIQGDDGEYGLFVTTVDGETADSSAQEWWCLYIDGESAMTGVDATPLTDGGRYELTLTVGY